MSDQTDLQNSFAREIYLAFVTETGPNEWDWQKLANAAFDAADQFNTVSQQRLNPQQSVRIGDVWPSAPPPATPRPDPAAASPLPGQIGALDPAAAAAVPPAPAPDPVQA